MVYIKDGILIVLIALAALTLLFTAIAAVVFEYSMKRRRWQPPGDRIVNLDGFAANYAQQIRSGAEYFLAQKPEEVSVKSRDGLVLKAWYLPCESAKRTVICVHGYRGDSLTNFGAIVPFFMKQGCNLLLIDQRSHGRSEGKYISFGVKERFDCLTWIDYINRRQGTSLPLYLDGLSMGSTTVLMAAGLELPENLVGIIADCGFTSPWDITAYHLKHAHLPTFPVLNILDWICFIRAGFRLKEVSSAQELRKARVPVFFVHGASDRYVPAEMSRTNFKECASEKQLEVFEGASHGASYLVGRERLEKLAGEFFEKCDRTWPR